MRSMEGWTVSTSSIGPPVDQDSTAVMRLHLSESPATVEETTGVKRNIVRSSIPISFLTLPFNYFIFNYFI